MARSLDFPVAPSQMQSCDELECFCLQVVLYQLLLQTWRVMLGGGDGALGRLFRGDAALRLWLR